MRTSPVTNLIAVAATVFGTSVCNLSRNSGFFALAAASTVRDTPQQAVERVIKEIQSEYLVPDRTATDRLLKAAGPLPSANTKADPRPALYAALERMMESLDPHSTFRDPRTTKKDQELDNNSYTGVGVYYLANRGVPPPILYVIPDSSADRAGLRAGDRIAAVDGHATISIDQLDKTLGGPVGNLVHLTIRRGTSPQHMQTFDVSIERQAIFWPPVSARMLPGDIAYIKIDSFTNNTGKYVREAVQKMAQENGVPLKGVMLDLREDPGGLLDEAVNVAGVFLPDTDGRLVLFTLSRDKVMTPLVASESDVTRGLPMVVLINGGTASAAEIVADALHDYHRATIVGGEESYGKAISQAVEQLPDTVKINGQEVPSLLAGSSIAYTDSYLLTPKGRSIQRLGQVPDVKVAGSRYLSPREENSLNALPNPKGLTKPESFPKVCSVKPGTEIAGLDPLLLDNDVLCAMSVLGVPATQGLISIRANNTQGTNLGLKPQ